MRSSLIMALLLGLLHSAQAATINVNVSSNVFNPNSITVNVGDTVQWNLTGGSHTVDDSGAAYSSGNLNSPSSYSHVFGSAGAFAYFCVYHQGCCAMTGVVNVQAPTTSTETPTITVTPTAVPPGSTATVTPTFSPTSTVSPTVTPGMPPVKLFDKSPELILAPNPQQIGAPVCLYSNSIPQESHWNIYNTALERVASLDFVGSALQCWDTSKATPGLYYIDAKWTLANGSLKRVKQKVVLWR